MNFYFLLSIRKNLNGKLSKNILFAPTTEELYSIIIAKYVILIDNYIIFLYSCKLM